MKALFVGIGINAYPGCPLKGCLNDIANTEKHLSDKFGITSCLLLTDTTPLKPTYDNIVSTLYEASVSSHKDNLDYCWIAYSGHGSQVIDKSGDETSGFDSCWCPIDYAKSGMLIDDYLAKILKTFNPKTKVFVLSDSCHSGTMGDLPYCYDAKKGLVGTECSGEKVLVKWDQNIVFVSGCLDTGTSADAYFAATGPGGALTTYFWKIVDNFGPIITVKQLIDELHKELKRDGYDQYPVLTCSQTLTADTPIITKKGSIWNF